MECKKDQVYGELHRMIMDNLLPPGSRLPNEVELAKKLGVGHVTLRSALSRLEAEGLVIRIRSKGTFVAENSRRTTFLMILPDGTENLDTPSRYILSGVETYAEKRSLTIERCPASLFLSFSPKQREEIKNRLQIKGVIFETGHRRAEEALITALKELKLPVVIPHGLASDSQRSPFLVLRTNEKAAFSDAYKYLASQGLKRIAGLYLDMPEEDHGIIRGFKRQELKDFLKENNLDYDDELIGLVPNESDRISNLVQQWMLGPNPPEAILCQSDRIAMRVCFMLGAMSVNIPNKVSIMGYSNNPGSQLMLPPLTTIDTLLKNCAQMAIDKLLSYKEWYQDNVAPKEIFTPYQLIERESVAKK
jgi:DNA-binding LacI/PurR family transcriptional regulator